LLHLENVLDQAAVDEILRVAGAGDFVPGRTTAAGAAAAVKRNLQVAQGSDAAERAGALLVERLRAHRKFMVATQPVRISAPRFSRYEQGMAYGDHLDAPLMGGEDRIRTDIAVTVFLVPADAYTGGELVIDTDYGIERCKGGVGDCVIYPASTFHRVDPVTQGVRAVGVLWVQSAVRDPAQRKILFDLAGVADFLDRIDRLGGPASLVRRAHDNLIRMWAEV
jgi:PKHD-type hydroxylase